MFFHQRFIPGLAIVSYMVGDEKTKQVAVIDPTRDIDEYVRIASEQALQITQVLETHVHADYVSGAVELKARLGGAPQIVVSGMGGAQWTPPYADRVVKDGDEIQLGTIRLKAIHTPGHTPEHVTWALFDHSRSPDVPWLLFTGDFVFVGDVGRPDLLGPDEQKQLAHQLYNSVFETLPGIPDFTEIFPSHGAGSLCGKAIGSRRSSTLGFERQFNPALQSAPEAEWTASLLKNMPLAPPYFKVMKKINALGPAVLGPNLPGQQQLSATQVHDRLNAGCLLLDVRQEEAFATAHIPHSINIPLGPSLPSWAGTIVAYDQPLLIVPGMPSEMPAVVTHLIRVGFDRIEGYLEGGIEAWKSHGFETEQLESIAATELDAKLKARAGRELVVLDVRTDGEWSGGHIDGAMHIHGSMFQSRYDEVPRDRPVVIICGSGYRGSITASFLMSRGYQNVSNVRGGMAAWKAANLPTVQ